MSLISDTAMRLAKCTFSQGHKAAIEHELTSMLDEVERRVIKFIPLCDSAAWYIKADFKEMKKSGGMK